MPIRAVVSYYGPVDLTEGYRNPPRMDPLDVRSIEVASLGGTPDQMASRYREASPITYVSGRLPPSLLIYGGRDHVALPRFAAMLHDRLRAAGATSVLLTIHGANMRLPPFRTDQAVSCLSTTHNSFSSGLLHLQSSE